MEEKLKREERNVNKNLYKIFLILLKYTPITLAINDIFHSILSYYKIDCYFLSSPGGVSIYYLSTLYILSYVFRFCYLYRIPLYYITITNIIATYDEHKGIPLDDLQMLRVYLILAGISIISYIILKVKRNAEAHNKKSTSEVYR